MPLFTSELFNPTMARELQPRPARSYRMPAFGPRYGRRGANPGCAPRAIAPAAYEIERIGDTCVLLEYDQAA